MAYIKYGVRPNDCRLLRFSDRPAVERRIAGFHQDDLGDWVADLECGHTQHVRHAPPMRSRPWVVTPEGRASRIGTILHCVQCVESGASAS